jgi:hypothetical protein
MVARSGEHRTDVSVKTTDRHADTHRVASIRRQFPVPGDLAPGARPGAGSAPAVPLFRPTAAPADDGIERIGAFIALDGQNRIAATKVTKPLGWSADTSLIARCVGGRVTITAGTRANAADIPVPLDSTGRLTLPPTACASLMASAGVQLIAVAVPATGELVLANAAGALASVTGPIDAPAPAVEPPAPAPPAPTRVRSAFRAAAVSS